MPELSPGEVLHVSLGLNDDPETARHYWAAAMSKEEAHAVDCGLESGFVTVFTTVPEAMPQKSEGRIGKIAKTLFRSGASGEELVELSLEAKLELAEKAKTEVGSEYAVYLSKMSEQNAENFAYTAQSVLEGIAKRTLDLKQRV